MIVWEIRTDAGPVFQNLSLKKFNETFPKGKTSKIMSCECTFRPHFFLSSQEDFKVFSNPNRSMILWFYEFSHLNDCSGSNKWFSAKLLEKHMDEGLICFGLGVFLWTRVKKQDYSAKEMMMPGCWGKVMITCDESQGSRKRGYSFQNARSLTVYAALLFPSLSTYLTWLKGKFSIENNAQLSP